MQGLSRKRPQTAGFGAVAADGRRVEDEATLASLRYFAPGERPRRPSQGAGSLTSPSDYSAVSRSAAGSPAVTPGWDASGTGLGLSMDKRSSGAVSPMFTGGESYFATKGRRSDAESASSSRSARPHSKESTPPDNLKQSPASQAEEKMAQEEQNAPEKPSDVGRKSLEFEKRSSTRESRHEAVEPREPSPNRRTVDRRAVSHGITGATTGQSKIERPHTQLHSYGADFGATFQSLPNTSTPLGAVPSSARPTTRRELGTSPTVMPPPSDRLKGLMLDSLPAHVFVALPQSGEIVWVNSRYLTYRGQTVQELYKDPWSSLHPDDRDEYLKAWSYSLRTGEQFSVQVRIRRFDGNYRWFYTRAVGSRDTRGVIVQWYGSHMDIHDQHIAELKAARQEEIEASEAKHRLLANLIPQALS